MAAKQLAELKDQIRELLENGYIYRSSPPWGAPVIFILKKDDTQQMCVNYHALNEVPSRTSTHCLGLMICLINFMALVCSLRSIFDRDIIS
jgi:hypothetical protein